MGHTKLSKRDTLLAVKDIDFTPAKVKRRKFDASTSQQTAIVNSGISSLCGVTETSDAQRNTELCSGSSTQHTMRIEGLNWMGFFKSYLDAAQNQVFFL